MNQRLPWACFHQLTSINKMHGVLSPGSPFLGLLLLQNTGQRPGNGIRPNTAGRAVGDQSRDCEHIAMLIYYGLSF